MANAEWLNRYVSIEKESEYGVALDGTNAVYGEVDDESFKQTFELLTRSDMSRQVASKAMTNTKYGEGSVNLAVQPDDFMGNIISAFLPVTRENTFWDDVTVGTEGFGYATGQGELVTATIDNRVYKAGYWEVRNGAQGALNIAYTDGLGTITLDSATTAWQTYNGQTVTASNLGWGVLGKPGSIAGTTGFYFSYSGATGSTLTGVVEYDVYTPASRGVTAAFSSAIANGTVPVDTPCVQFVNHLDGIIPGRPYFYITEPLARVKSSNVAAEVGKNAKDMASNVYTPTTTALSPTGLSDYLAGGSSGITGTAATNSTAAATIAGAVGGASKHVFNEPVIADDTYPSFTLRVGRESKQHVYTGMAASRISFSANLNEYVMASVDWLGKAEDAPEAIQTGVSFSGNDVDALHFSGAELYVDGSLATTTKILGVSLEININRDLDSAYAVGQNTLTRMPPSRTREITGTMEFNEILYDDMSGAVGEPTYNDMAVKTTVHTLHGGAGRPALKFMFMDGEDADHMEIVLYNVRFEAPTASVSGRDPARMSVGFQAFYDSKAKGAAKAIQIKMKGTQLKTTDY